MSIFHKVFYKNYKELFYSAFKIQKLGKKRSTSSKRSSK